MSEEEKKLIKEFKIICAKKWIRSVSKSFGSIGLTFENELKKKPDSLFLPDYYGIELKCISRYSRYSLFLFTIAFDGPTFPEINRIVAKYGTPDKDFPDKKVLFTEVSAVDKTLVNNKYKFKLHIDKKEEKLFLDVYNLNDNIVERKSFVYLKSIQDHLEVKLNKLALIYASKKKDITDTYFRYYKLIIYKLISFDKFIELLETGNIKVDLISRISKSGVDKGRYRNKNLVFSLKKDKIEKLFKKIYSLDNDLKEHNKNSNFFIFN